MNQTFTISCSWKWLPCKTKLQSFCYPSDVLFLLLVVSVQMLSNWLKATTKGVFKPAETNNKKSYRIFCDVHVCCDFWNSSVFNLHKLKRWKHCEKRNQWGSFYYLFVWTFKVNKYEAKAIVINLSHFVLSGYLFLGENRNTSK